MSQYPHLYKNPYLEELRSTARKIATPGKGILAADESTGTIGKRFKAINLENNRANRREYRRLLFTTPGLAKNISGVILYEETLYEKTEDGKTELISYLKQQDICIGIKVDMGTRNLPGSNGEVYTQGLTDMDKRTAAYYKQGARFAKWRAIVKIGNGLPSAYAIQETAWGLARYAAISQANGLVPIVEPEILMDGDHSSEVCRYWTEKVLSACYKALSDQNVDLDGTLLKPNMVISGNEHRSKSSPAEVAAHTVLALQRSVPPAVPGIMFLSGGQSEEQATQNLNAINSPGLGPRPWHLSFSYGRALQQSVIATWAGRPENVGKAQQALLNRAKANGDANLGKYSGGAGGAASSQSLYQKGYTY
jgi:fructose-bisphosphate aldolase class I